MANNEVNKEMPTSLEEKKTTPKEVVLERVKAAIDKLDKKEFTVYFYVIDTKGVPSGSLLYIYKMAYELKELGYNVMMLHNERGGDFIGIGEWAEKKYADLPHANIENQKKVAVSPADFLLIPDIYTEIMSQTKNLPCKRIIIFQNDEYFTRFIPLGVSPYTYKITDAIVNTSNSQAWIEKNLSRLKTRLVRPAISSTMFRKPEKPRQLIVNFVCKDGNDTSRMVKPFFWKYPELKWVAHTQLNGLSQEVFADALRNGAITVWVDEEASFGYTPLEALKTGSIVIAKMPKKFADWMKTENGLTDAIIWFDDFAEIPDLIAELVSRWMNDDIPQELYDEIDKMGKLHTREDMKADIEKVFVEGFFKERKEDFESVLADLEKELENKETTNEE